MNRVSLVGRLTNKPELRYTNSEVPYARFGLAVTRTFNREEVDFINIVTWRKQAEIVSNYLDKGSLVSVDGRIQTGSFTDKDGNKRYSFDVVGDNVQFLETKAQAEQRRQQEGNNAGPNPYDFEQDQGNNQGQENYQDLESQDDIYSNMGDSVALDDADID